MRAVLGGALCLGPWLKRLALWVHSGGAKKFDFSNRTDRSDTFPHSPTNLLRRATCRIPPIVVYYVRASNISSNASISISLYSPCSVITQGTSSAISLNQGIGRSHRVSCHAEPLAGEIPAADRCKCAGVKRGAILDHRNAA